MQQMVELMFPYLDKHLALGLLNFLADQGVDTTEAMTQVLEMTALTAEGTVKPEHEERIRAAAAQAKPALDEFFVDAVDPNYTYQFNLTGTQMELLKSQGDLSFEVLGEKKGITQAVMQAVLRLAYLYYDKASYGDASELLSLCICVTGYDLRTEDILWGKLMCDTGACNWQSALEVASTIRRNQNSFDEEVFREASATTVRARAYLLHWVLFPIFKGGHQFPVQLLYIIFDNHANNVYESVVETVCPHYLRYICAAALLNPSRPFNFRAAAQMTQNIYEYSDALTQLVSLIHKSSLEAALEILPEVEELVRNDYFLVDFAEDLVHHARRTIFQKYIALHTVVSIPYVAEKLGMEKADAEKWLANLISEGKQRAKVDSVNEQLNVEPQTKAVDTIVLDKLDTASRK